MKGQSAIEFISVYGFMLLIAALFIALVVLFAFSAQNSIQTSQCSGYSGFYCSSAQAIYNATARNSIVFIALDSEQSAPVDVLSMNVIIDNATYTGSCEPNVAAPAERINCTIGISTIKRNGQQVVGSYIINGQYCNSPVYNVFVEECIRQNVTYTGFFSTFVTDHLSLGYRNTSVAAKVVGAVAGRFTWPVGVAISPNGQYAYVTNMENLAGSGFDNTGYLSVISTSANTITGRISPGLTLPYAVAISPSGTYAYVTNSSWPPGSNSSIRMVDTGTGNTLMSFTSCGACTFFYYAVAFSPSGADAWVAQVGSTYSVAEINTATRQTTNYTTLHFYPGIGGIAVSPSGAYAYIVNPNIGGVDVVNTANGSVANIITSAQFSDPSGDAISPDGKYLYVTNIGTGSVLIISTANDSVVGSINLGFYIPEGIAFAPSGSFLYVVNAGSNNVVIVNPGTYN